MRSVNKGNFDPSKEMVTIQGKSVYSIDNRISRFIADKKLYVLRDKKTNTALNVSYTEDGLQWTTDGRGKLLYYEDARIVSNTDIKMSSKTGKHTPSNIYIVGSKGAPKKSDKVYVERFVPTNQSTLKGQAAEYTWTGKAFQLSILNAEAFEA